MGFSNAWTMVNALKNPLNGDIYVLGNSTQAGMAGQFVVTQDADTGYWYLSGDYNQYLTFGKSDSYGDEKHILGVTSDTSTPLSVTNSTLTVSNSIDVGSISSSNSSISANSIKTNSGDIDASTSDITATESVESAGVVKAKSLNAPRLLGAGSGMSTLGGGLTVAGQVKGVTAGTDDTDAVNYSQVKPAIKALSVSGKTITYTKIDGTTGTITTQDTNTTYSAGNGVSLSGTTFSAKPYNGITVDSNGIGVKAGTNVTVNSNGVSVTGSGSVASGNTGLISGGTLFTEGRITADGTFAKKANSIATNITALDTASKNAIKGLSVSGQTITYTRGDGTTGTITTQDNNTTYSAFTGATS